MTDGAESGECGRVSSKSEEPHPSRSRRSSEVASGDDSGGGRFSGGGGGGSVGAGNRLVTGAARDGGDEFFGW